MKKRLLHTIIIFSIFFLLAWLLLFVTKSDMPSICLIRRLTGLKCPGCGMSRALLALIRLDISAAIGHNLLVLPILLYIVYVLVCASISYIKSGKVSLFPKPEWLNISFLAVLVIFTVIRNIIKI